MNKTKFRIWDSIDMVDLSIINYIDFRNKTVSYWCEYDGNKLVDYDNKNTVLMQYIGLKDIQEKEVYVGDFLKDDEGFIWEVLPLRDAMFCISCDDLMAVESAYPRVRCCEVVGNIFENNEDEFKVISI